MVANNLHTVDFVAACGVPVNLYFDLNEVIDLSYAVLSLAHSTEASLLNAYKESFRTHNENTYLHNWPLVPHRLFGTIMPKYRNKPPLKYNLNDTQIIMALCFKVSGKNVCLPSRPYIPFPACTFKQIYEGLRYVALQILPVALTQSRFVVSHTLSHVEFGGSQYYHPAQRIMSPPLWITGCSYNESTKQPEVCSSSLVINKSAQQQHQEQQQQYNRNLQVNYIPTLQSNNIAPLTQFYQDQQQLGGAYYTVASSQRTQPAFF